jgi:protein with PEP-CTERM/exosortase system signal
MKALPKKVLRLTVFAIAVTSLFCVQPAQAYTVTLEQMGADVVANGSGAINLTGLAFFGPGSFFITTLVPSLGRISTGPPPSGLGSVDVYRVFSGPANFGSGGQHNATESLSSGNFVGIQASVNELFVPHGYISNSALSSSATWTGATFASLGVTPGTFVWTWGTGANQNFTLIIGGAGVPDGGSAVSLLGFGLLGLAALRRKLPLLRGRKS